LLGIREKFNAGDAFLGHGEHECDTGSFRWSPHGAKSAVDERRADPAESPQECVGHNTCTAQFWRGTHLNSHAVGADQDVGIK
jgi:hypothetical protein